MKLHLVVVRPFAGLARFAPGLAGLGSPASCAATGAGAGGVGAFSGRGSAPGFGPIGLRSELAGWVEIWTAEIVGSPGRISPGFLPMTSMIFETSTSSEAKSFFIFGSRESIPKIDLTTSGANLMNRFQCFS